MFVVKIVCVKASSDVPRPFVKWAGGKQQMLNFLAPCFPRKFNAYYEPFLGGGAVFLYLTRTRGPFSAVLSDLNAELIDTWLTVKNNVDQLIVLLKNHRQKYLENPEEYFYRVRTAKPEDPVDQAARFIFLNKTCFNGLYRVNSKGEFNVPWSRSKKANLCDEENLHAVAKSLANVKLVAADYLEILKQCERNDCVYIDPPYQPESATAYFTSYTKRGFTEEDQKVLAECFKTLDKKGCVVVLSNSDTPLIWQLYAGYNIIRVPTLRAISSVGAKRKNHTELIVTNRKTTTISQFCSPTA